MLHILANSMLVASGFYTPTPGAHDEPRPVSRLARLFRRSRAHG